jgi:hypothetical protein
MKSIFLAFTVLSILALPALAANSTLSPLAIVNKRMDAYNKHDLKSFLATYADNVEIYTYPTTSLAKGKEHLTSIFEPMFKEGAVHVTIHTQLENDSYVINHETVEYLGKKTKYISIYKVENNLITEVRFVRD